MTTPDAGATPLFDSAEVAAIGSWILNTNQPRSRHDDDAAEKAQAAESLSSSFLVAIGPQLQVEAAGERPLHIHIQTKTRTKLRGGPQTSLEFVVVTNARAWLAEHSDEELRGVQTFGWDQIHVRKKRLVTATIKTEPGHLELVASGRVAEELTELVRTRGATGPTSVLTEVLGTSSTMSTESAVSNGAWHPDPTGRHELRWWDGGSWTPNVADGGVTATDPV